MSSHSVHHILAKTAETPRVAFAFPPDVSVYCFAIRYFSNEMATGADMRPAIVSGMVTEEAQISYWPIFSLSLETFPEVFANVNLT